MSVKLVEMRKAYGLKLDAMEGLVEDKAAFELAEGEAKTMAESIARLEGLEKQKAAGATALAVTGTETETVPATAKSNKPLVPGAKLARAIVALASTKGYGRHAAEFVQANWGDDPEMKSVQRVLAASNGAGGGFLVPTDMQNELIELLRPASVVMASGPRVVDMPRGNIMIPGMATGSSASYVGENTNLPVTEPTFRDVTLSAKKLGAIVPISNDMIRFPTLNADTFVQEDLVAALGQKMDLVMLRGTGSAFEPKGLRQYAIEAAGENYFQANATVNLANVTTDLGKMELALHNANLPQVRTVWLMSWRTKVYLGNLRDGNGNFAFPEVNATGTLRGKRVMATTQIPNTLGSGNKSEIMLVEFSQFIVGEAMGMEITIAEGAAYHNGSAVVSGFSQDQTAIRALVQHDTGLRQVAAVVLMDEVLWQ